MYVHYRGVINVMSSVYARSKPGLGTNVVPREATALFYSDATEDGKSSTGNDPYDELKGNGVYGKFDECTVNLSGQPYSRIDAQRYAIHLQFEFPAMPAKEFADNYISKETDGVLEIPINVNALQSYLRGISNISGAGEKECFNFMPASIFVTAVMNKGLGVDVRASLATSYISPIFTDEWRDWFERTEFVNSTPAAHALPASVAHHVATGFTLHDGVSSALSTATTPAMHVYELEAGYQRQNHVPFALLGSNVMLTAKRLKDESTLKIENVPTSGHLDDPFACYLISRPKPVKDEIDLRATVRGPNSIELTASPSAVATMMTVDERIHVQESRRLMRLHTLKVAFSPQSVTWKSIGSRLSKYPAQSHHMVHLGIRLCIEGYAVKPPSPY
jgi:hypothetical protein